MTNKEQIGRLAMRHEGNWWNAYYALQDTMEGAVLLGSIPIGAAQNPDYKERFMSLMRDIVSDMLKGTSGIKPDWNGPEPAPEHERAGNA